MARRRRRGGWRGRLVLACRDRGTTAEAGLSAPHPGQRPDGDPVRGSLHPDRASPARLPGGLEERATRADRVRASLRTHDVQGIAQCRTRLPSDLDLPRGRRWQRLHDRGRYDVPRDGAGAVSAAGAVARSRPDGDPAYRRGHLRGGAAGGQRGAALALRGFAVRVAVRDHV